MQATLSPAAAWLRSLPPLPSLLFTAAYPGSPVRVVCALGPARGRVLRSPDVWVRGGGGRPSGCTVERSSRVMSGSYARLCGFPRTGERLEVPHSFGQELVGRVYGRAREKAGVEAQSCKPNTGRGTCGGPFNGTETTNGGVLMLP